MHVINDIHILKTSVSPETSEKLLCHHCGEVCDEHPLMLEEKAFCCVGCQTVYELLAENNLCGYYDLHENAGVSLKSKNFEGKYEYLKNPEIEATILDFKSDNLHKVTLYLPAVHCTSCVWLLENFHKIKAGVLYSRLAFLKKELSITYDPSNVNLKEIVELLATLGYEPQITLQNSHTQTDVQKKSDNRLLRQVAVTGFAAGNIMLLSFPEYFKLDLTNAVDAQYQQFFLYLNVLLALPVYFYGAADYLKGGWQSVKDIWSRNTQTLSVDLPIAIGITALFIRSLYETFSHQGGAYWDSMAGLVFFLLVGKWVQQKTFDFLSFERTYKSYFPLAVEVKDADGKLHFKNVDELKKGDLMRIRQNELIPADAILKNGQAHIDYSFVTGESAPEHIHTNELIYAGGRQRGAIIELQVAKEVSKSYLTQLWNDHSFQKEKTIEKTDFANAFSKYFTIITLGIALSTALYWYVVDAALVWPAFTAVLMVACPCALTLSMPFTMSTVMEIFGKNKFYVRNQDVIQLMSDIKKVVFDKTGTLTHGASLELHWCGEALETHEIGAIASLANNSMHPLSKSIVQYYGLTKVIPLSQVHEKEGAGISGYYGDDFWQIGNAAFLDIPIEERSKDARVYVKVNQKTMGYFKGKPSFRAGFDMVLNNLKSVFDLYLLSGDKNTEQESLSPFLANDHMLFEQKPEDKLAFIKKLQENNEPVLMIGDGLNDAGALRQSQIGIALTENTQAFTPASDAILDASEFDRLPLFLAFGRKAVQIVKWSFILSLVYNFICISWAVSGTLSPVVAAIFMPLSSISVVLFAVITTYIYAYKNHLLNRS